MAKAPFILLVNPWVTDFAAHDLWAKPLGLLSIASLLREGGCGVALLDCLDRHDPETNTHPDIIPGKNRLYGTGKYPRMLIPKPAAYAKMPRRYYRHGIHPDSLRKHLLALPKPDLILVTSIMTYWHLGVQETVRVIREFFPEVPLWLGGIYAALCPDHARNRIDANEIVSLPMEDLCTKVEAATGFTLRNKPHWGRLDCLPPPALELLPQLTYAPIIAGQGCPFRCPYCASHVLQPHWERRSSDAIYRDIAKWNMEYGVVDFAFYDDALLLQAEETLKPALERVCREALRVRFHTPNALHIRALTAEWSNLLFESGFTTIRLGLETTRADRQIEWGGKVETKMFFKAVENLLAAGFSSSQIGVYLLCGIPGQSPEEVSEAIQIVGRAGVQPYLCEYSPVPGTALWPQACALSPYDLAGEPLYHNNTFFACRRADFTYSDMVYLKDLVLQTRRNSRSGATHAPTQGSPLQPAC
ncbi:MAG: B12-binding domain-containing radical SAM protein [Syntrophobacteraceae bacterium]